MEFKLNWLFSSPLIAQVKSSPSISVAASVVTKVHISFDSTASAVVISGGTSFTLVTRTDISLVVVNSPSLTEKLMLKELVPS